MWIAGLRPWLLALAVAMPADAQMRGELSRSHDQRGGGLALFAATLVEGGGATGSNRNPQRGVVEVTEEFAGQHAPTGRVAIGKQDAVFRAITYSKAQDQAGFELPPNGTRFIAFGDPRKPPLVIYANQMFADTASNRVNIAAGRAPRQPAAGSVAANVELVLFVASIGVAFASVFLAWFRVRYGVIGLAVSVAIWLAYETQIPTHVNIRVDLVILFPFLIAAAISTMAAAADSSKKKDARG